MKTGVTGPAETKTSCYIFVSFVKKKKGIGKIKTLYL